MGHGQRGEVHRQIQVLFHSGSVAGLSDGQLLERFTTRGDQDAERAFALLLQRHGATVLRVCRGVLRDEHDAEDAFQATFLVLASKAGSIRRRHSVGSWLYGVALRVASEMRSVAARRRVHEGRAAGLRPETVGAEVDDLGLVVLEELGQLPDRLRAAVVLCYMEGHTCEEAASQLGWPVGTVKSRLNQARQRLRGRLLRRGLSPLVVGSPLNPSGSVWPSLPAVPNGLEDSVVHAAVRLVSGRTLAGVASPSVFTLVEGVQRAMVVSTAKWSVVVAALMFGAVVAGTSVAARTFSGGAGPGASVGGKGRDDGSGTGSNARSLALAEPAKRVATDAEVDPLDLSDPVRSGASAISQQELQVRLARARRLLERNESLSRKGQVSSSEVDEARFEVDLIQAKLDASRQEMEEALERLQGRLRVKTAELGAARTRTDWMGRLSRENVKDAVELALTKAEQEVREAELLEVDIQIKQVKRRLDQLPSR